ASRCRLAAHPRAWHPSGHRLSSLHRGSSIAPRPVLTPDLNTHLLAASPPRRALRHGGRAGDLGDRPGEAAELAGDRRDSDDRALAAGGHPTIAPAQAAAGLGPQRPHRPPTTPPLPGHPAPPPLS